MQSKRKAAYQTHKLSFAIEEVMSMVRLYCNNRTLNSADLGGILATLETAYWQSQITWCTLVEIQMAFFPPAITPDPEAQPSAYLQLAFEYTGRVIKSRYLLQEVIGFVDAGVLFRATDIVQGAAGGGEVNSILCTLETVTPHLGVLESVAEDIATTKITSCVFVQQIIKDKGKSFLILPALKGVPLCSWLTERESTGILHPQTVPWLRQFGKWIRGLEAYPLLRKAIHPGQVWVDSETHTLTALLLPLPEALLTSSKRAAYYHSTLLENSSKTRAGATYQLMAIGYELYTGSAPDTNHFKTFFTQATTLPKRTFRALQRVLLENKSISWRAALGKLGISKVGLYFRRGVLISFSFIAIFFGVDTGMRFWPDLIAYMAPPAPEKTVVLTPQTKDQHINSLKAAFFNQVAERDIVGARSSLQALQQLLPSDDIFIQKIAPQQLAESYLQAAQQVAESDRLAAGLLVRAAERVAPDFPALKTPEIKALQLSAEELASITEETTLADEALLQSAQLPPAEEVIVAQTAPSTPNNNGVDASAQNIFDGTHTGVVNMPPVAAKSAAEVGLKADPCLNAFHHKGKSTLVHCADALDQKHLGPRLVVMVGQQPMLSAFAIAQQPVASAEYQAYCKQTPGCILPSVTQTPTPGVKAGLKLDDVEAEIQKYNAYCAETGACAALSAPSYVALQPLQIKAYLEWLTSTTGYRYRLPTEQEWAYMFDQLSRKEASALRWGMVFPGSTEWVQTPSGELREAKSLIQTIDKANQPQGTVFRVVRELK